MTIPWTFFLHFGIISSGLLLATLLRSRIFFFQKYLIPNSLTAGFMLLIFYNYFGPRFGLFGDDLGTFVYHLLNISFVAMSLRRSPQKGTFKRASGTAIGIISMFAVQSAIGLGIGAIFIISFYPELFPSFGFLLPLGFAQGPGQAYAIGSGWESFGFQGAGSIGLTFAAIGFIWACFGGFYLMNKGVKKGWVKPEEIQGREKIEIKKGLFPKGAKLPEGARLTTESEAIDSMSYNIGVVFFTYFLTFLLLKGITFLLSLIGPMGSELAVNLWGISFIFCGISGMVVKRIMMALKIDYTLDTGSLNRIGGTAVDYMVAGSIGAISLVVVTTWWVPILVMSSLAGIATFFIVPWMCSRMFEDHHFHRALLVYGVSTGTLSTGIVLLRVLDPDFETPTLSDYMYAAVMVFALVIPLILSLNLPAYGYRTGNPLYYWITAAVVAGYLVFSFTGYLFLARRRSFKNPGTFWHQEKKGQD